MRVVVRGLLSVLALVDTATLACSTEHPSGAAATDAAVPSDACASRNYLPIPEADIYGCDALSPDADGCWPFDPHGTYNSRPDSGAKFPLGCNVTTTLPGCDPKGCCAPEQCACEAIGPVFEGGPGASGWTCLL